MKTYTLLFLFLVLGSRSSAQHYSFSQHKEAYVDLSGDIASPASIKVISNNCQAFGYSLADSFIMLLNGAIFNKTETEQVAFSPLLGDLLFDLSFSKISYKVEQSNGFEILKFQWKDLTLENDPSVRVNFQVWIYEQDQTIEFRYGPGVVSDDFSVSILHQFEGAANPDHLLSLGGDANNPDVASSLGDRLYGKPADSTVFRFTYMLSSVQTTNPNLVSVYPNPGKGTFQFNFEGVEEVSAFDALGREYKVNQLSGIYQLENAVSGIYFLDIKMEDGTRARSRLTIEN